jgi:two-component system sensor kinase FixL
LAQPPRSASHKRAGRGARDLEERFQLAVAGAKDGIWDWDLSTGAVYYSPRWKQIVGCEEAAVEGCVDAWYSRIHPDDAARVRADLDAHLEGRLPHFENEHRLRHADGTYHWVLARAASVRDDRGRPYRVAGSLTDITERRLVQEHLRQSEERFALAVAGANDGVWDWNMAEDRLYFSDRLKAILGYEDLINEPEPGQWLRRIHPEDRAGVARAIGLLVVGRTDQFENEHRLRHRDGTDRWVLLRGRLVRDALGKPYRMAGSLTDITARKRVERRLRESEERYRQLVEEINDVIFTVDAQGTVTYVSPVIRQLGGYSPAEVTGRSLTEFVFAEDLDRVMASFQRTVQGALEPLDFRVIAKEGAIRWVRTSSRPIVHAGVAVGLRGVLTDISERKQAEAALVDSERRFRALIEHSSDLITLIRADGTFAYFSPSLTRILGYQPEELVGRDVLDLVHPENRGRAVELFADLASRPNATVTGTWRCRHKDGAWRWLESVGTNFLSEPSLQAVIVNSRDVTDRRAAEEGLRDREERLRKIFEEGPLGMGIVGPDKRILQVNGTLCRMLGHSQPELVGRSITELTHPDDAEISERSVRQLFAGEIPNYQLEKRYLRRDGQSTWVSLTTSLVRDARGAPLYAIGMVQDITDRRRAEAEAQERLADLAHVLRVATANEMAAILAHELNQPLAAIINYAKGCARRLQSVPGEPGRLAQVQEDIAEEALRAAAVIRRLRQFLRKEPPQRQTLVLNDVVGGVVDLLQTEARTHQVGVHLELAPDLPPVRADRIQIEQVLLNLIRNAFEAMEGQPERRELNVRTSLPQANDVQVAVSDTGAGLPADLADRVFAPFFTTKPSGLGMGLAISRLIVEAHGGQLWATPRPDGGSAFHFTLPAVTSRRARTPGE